MNASKPAAQQVALPASRISNQPLPLLRAQLAALTFYSPHLSEAEKLRANHCIHEREDTERLAHWLHTVKAELARRNMAAQLKKALAQYAAPKRPTDPLLYLRNNRQLGLPCRTHKTIALAHHYVPDHAATIQDRRAAAQFQPICTLTYAHLLGR
jgi:hypothetical protein